ncbi:hypothetical protein D3C75_1048150 [compost metagenome]
MPKQRGTTRAFSGKAIGAVSGIPLSLAHTYVTQHAAAISGCQVQLGLVALRDGVHPQRQLKVLADLAVCLQGQVRTGRHHGQRDGDAHALAIAQARGVEHQ